MINKQTNRIFKIPEAVSGETTFQRLMCMWRIVAHFSIFSSYLFGLNSKWLIPFTNVSPHSNRNCGVCLCMFARIFVDSQWSSNQTKKCMAFQILCFQIQQQLRTSDSMRVSDSENGCVGTDQPIWLIPTPLTICFVCTISIYFIQYLCFVCKTFT